VSPSDEPGDEPGTDESTSSEPSGGRRLVLLISVAAVAVLAVIGVVVYQLTSGDDAADEAAGEVPVITGSAVPTSTIPAPPPAGSTPPPLTTSSSATSAAPPPEGADAGAAQSVAEQAAAAISGADVATLNQLSCDPTTAGGEETFPADAKAEVVGEPKIDGDTATIDVQLTLEGAEPTVVPMPLTWQDNRWCIP
jgi:hypothetical protein